MKPTDPILYIPGGRAGEYAENGYALNLYKGCPHGCRYCYVPCNRFVKAEDIPAAREKFRQSLTSVPFALERLETIRAKRDVFGKCIHMIEEVMENSENAPSD